ncbi:MAG: glycerol-3-phosphate dehydrogenase [Chitinophagaceae bacterium]|nr:glycerol-3-phosphate dehydrogenase [Chitinophagaceae bacterium]MCW5929846.1 glycerol-3-phosphate dehydrogenase [Chitinophagaceae bacterium]
MQFGITGSGTWATALAKILTDGGLHINWLVRDEDTARHIKKRGHNPRYLTSVSFDTGLLSLHTVNSKFIDETQYNIIATPSAYVTKALEGLRPKHLAGKKIISAVKGILPQQNMLLNDFLKQKFDFPLDNYFTIMGPCHAEEVAGERLSYLTFSGTHRAEAQKIADKFRTGYINTIVNTDVYGVQYAAILKNIYAVASGIALGKGYGDNFQSVLISNCADEMAGFLRKVGIRNMKVGIHSAKKEHQKKSPNYAASVYLGDLLVTCYSLFSRNRTFGAMVGKGYSVQSAQVEMKMVAEGYNASRSIYSLNKEVNADMPIARTVYEMLWKGLSVSNGLKRIEDTLV